MASERVRDTLLELAEEPGLWLPPDPTRELIARDGYSVGVSGRAASVERIRLDGDGVEAALDDVRTLARERDLDHATWWVGERTTPAGLAERLGALGLEPDPDAPLLTSLTLDSPPAGAPAVEVRRVASVDEYLQGLEVNWEVWDVPDPERAERRAGSREAWDAVATDPSSLRYVAVLDGQPVGYAVAVFTRWGGLLLGGATLPHARGRGVYASLVHARWRDAAARGTPRLIVSAGAQSTPILQRLGFARIGAVRLLRDRL